MTEQSNSSNSTNNTNNNITWEDSTWPKINPHYLINISVDSLSIRMKSESCTITKEKEDEKLFIDQWNGLNWPYKAVQNTTKNRIEVYLLDEETNKLGKIIFKVYSIKTLNEIKMIDV